MKVIKSAPDSSAMLIAADTYSQITAGPCSMTVTRQDGTFINGPLSISSQIDSIRIGGVFKMNPILASCLPSTMITPIPTLVLDIPVKNLGSASAISSLLLGLL